MSTSASSASATCCSCEADRFFSVCDAPIAKKDIIEPPSVVHAHGIGAKGFRICGQTQKPLLRQATKIAALDGQRVEPCLGARVMTCESNVRASQTLMSRRNIFVVEKLRDSLSGQVYCGGAIGADKWNLNAIGLLGFSCANRSRA